jgi:hypothetical protein
MFLHVLALAWFVAGVVCSPRAAYDARPYAQHGRRAVANLTESALTVDLGYSIYRGFRNQSAQLNNFRGYVA